MFLNPGSRAKAKPRVIPPELNCGRLTFVSGTALSYAPYSGNLLKINGVNYLIPAGGIAGLNSISSCFLNGVRGQALALSTLYYVYAFIDKGGAVTADFSTTTHATSTAPGNIGVEIKSGDNSRSLIGMVRVNASTQFANSATQRFVVSWFNRRNIGGVSALTANRAVTATTYTEINTEIRVEFVTWGEEAVTAIISGSVGNGSSGGATFTSIGFDGATAEETFCSSQQATGLAGQQLSCGCAIVKNGLAEGYHFATALSLSGSTQTGTYSGSATVGQRTALTVNIRG